MDTTLITPTSRLTGGYGSLNSFAIVKGPDGARGFHSYLAAVFDAVETLEAHAVDTDGLLIHSESRIGDSCLMVVDSKPDWPFTPAMLQVNVEDPEEVLRRARERGARVITEVSPFYGSTITRFQDPWHNIWWLFGPADEDAPELEWDPEVAAEEGESEVHASICRAMEGLVPPGES
ncbi:VOC family protein [Brachybacterium paraconglomeratum]|uniref:VOC family protein n=1 Tax=Brachybacterium paraconglomeratum TaxID=173362 RepID=UPI003FD03A99